jgi:opacity protein-like surface antigen
MSVEVLPLSFAAGAARFDEAQAGWELLETSLHGDGVRTYSGRVAFEHAFNSPPVVQIGVTGFDIDNGDNARLNVGIKNVDVSGFDVELRTWLNTRIWSVDLSWFAIGH